jgi:hypothetical protein
MEARIDKKFELLETRVDKKYKLLENQYALLISAIRGYEARSVDVE